MMRKQWMKDLQSLMEVRLQLKELPPLAEQHRLNEDLRIDSLMLIQLLVWIEAELGLRIPEEEVEPGVFRTVGSILDFMEGPTPIESVERQ